MAPGELKIEDLINNIKEDSAQSMEELTQYVEDIFIEKSKKEYRKEKRAYRRMRKRHRKELRKMVKQDRPWDYEYIFIMLETKLTHTLEYFSQGYNILQSKESLNTIITTLTKAVEAIRRRNEGWDNDELNCIDANKYYYNCIQEALKVIGDNYEYWWD